MLPIAGVMDLTPGWGMKTPLGAAKKNKNKTKTQPNKKTLLHKTESKGFLGQPGGKGADAETCPLSLHLPCLLLPNLNPITFTVFDINDHVL